MNIFVNETKLTCNTGIFFFYEAPCQSFSARKKNTVGTPVQSGWWHIQGFLFVFCNKNVLNILCMKKTNVQKQKVLAS